jgi:hypothetical protein
VKDKRIISIKNPKFRKIRDELRKVWLQASNKEWDKIYNEMEDIDSDSEGDSIPMDELVPSQLNRFRELQQLKSLNEEIGRKSICMCYTCGKPDQDMYYNHPYRAWFCVGCASLAKAHHARIEEKKEHGDYMCDDDNGFSQTFSS